MSLNDDLQRLIDLEYLILDVPIEKLKIYDPSLKADLVAERAALIAERNELRAKLLKK